MSQSERRRPPLKIDWPWLRQTPPGTWGRLPGVGLNWYHPVGTPTQCEVITVDLGHCAVTRFPKGKGRPYEHTIDAEDRAALRARCPNMLADRG